MTGGQFGALTVPQLAGEEPLDDEAALAVCDQHDPFGVGEFGLQEGAQLVGDVVGLGDPAVGPEPADSRVNDARGVVEEP
ncbi:hypothetical protein ACNFR7_29935 [Streptomyces sp. RM1]